MQSAKGASGYEHTAHFITDIPAAGVVKRLRGQNGAKQAGNGAVGDGALRSCRAGCGQAG